MIDHLDDHWLEDHDLRITWNPQRAPQAVGASRGKREGEQVYLMDTCIAFRATSLEHANRLATEIAAEIRESDRIVLAHVCLVEQDESGVDDRD